MDLGRERMSGKGLGRGWQKDLGWERERDLGLGEVPGVRAGG